MHLPIANNAAESAVTISLSGANVERCLRGLRREVTLQTGTERQACRSLHQWVVFERDRQLGQPAAGAQPC
jgi:hypothetical protein